MNQPLQVPVNPDVFHGTPAGEWLGLDIVEKIEHALQGSGLFVNTSGVFEWRSGMAVDTPWIHVKHADGKRCNLDHFLLFNYFGFVPRRCMECWKTVVAPRTLRELFQLLDLQKKMGVPSKCGIEMRPYTDRFYGGYFYSNSLEEGRARYKEVRDAVDAEISPDVPVVLKRACTEFELCLGPSPFWHYGKEQERVETMVEDVVPAPLKSTAEQPTFVKARVFRRWIQHAYTRMDHTYKDFTGGQPLYRETVKYHKGSLEDVQKDLLAGKLAGCGNCAQENAVNAVSFIEKFISDHGAGAMDAVAEARGILGKNFGAMGARAASGVTIETSGPQGEGADANLSFAVSGHNEHTGQ